MGMLLFSWAWASAQSQRDEEAFDYFRKWLEEDVVYIITPEEKATFLKLTTDEERENFIEQFWARRDPDPTTAENEFREEHFRRIAYANEHFHSGVPGWRTDRGIIYIKFGPPTGVEKRPEGGPYVRKSHEGGGFTSTYPFEVWFYNHIPGVGDGIELEFVDPSKTNEYRLAKDAEEKDAFLYVPGAGQTLAESLGFQSRYDRLRVRGIGNQDSGNPHDLDPTFQPLRLQDYPMERLSRLYKLSSAPAIKYKDLERLVDVRITYDQLPVTVQQAVMRLSPRVGIAVVTLFVENSALQFKELETGKVKRAEVEIYGRVEDLGGKLVHAFEDSVRAELRPDSPPAGTSVFQKHLPLEKGRYKLSLVVRDLASGKVSTTNHVLVIPESEPGRLTPSSVILTRRVQETPEGSGLGDAFVFGKYKVLPVDRPEFQVSDQFVQAYFEVYGFQLDAGRLEPSARVEISLLYEGREVFPFTELQDEFEYAGDRLLVYKTLPFRGLIPGDYRVLFRVTDRISGAEVRPDVTFRITG
ncbi:MAG: hypothetical protein Kow001_14790 [Acidobacteriota bacterium]